jgi:hypothetical protein
VEAAGTVLLESSTVNLEGLMNQAALKWLYMILIAAACGSADCAEPLGSSGTLVYQSGSGFFKRELSAKASALSPSRSLLSGQETVIYDWTSFVSAVANDAPKDWAQIKVEGTPGTALGSQWRKLPANANVQLAMSQRQRSGRRNHGGVSWQGAGCYGQRHGGGRDRDVDHARQLVSLPIQWNLAG